MGKVVALAVMLALTACGGGGGAGAGSQVCVTQLRYQDYGADLPDRPACNGARQILDGTNSQTCGTAPCRTRNCTWDCASLDLNPSLRGTLTLHLVEDPVYGWVMTGGYDVAPTAACSSTSVCSSSSDTCNGGEPNVDCKTACWCNSWCINYGHPADNGTWIYPYDGGTLPSGSDTCMCHAPGDNWTGSGLTLPTCN